MGNKSKQQHIASIIMLSMTAIFWGAGFVLNDQLLASAFSSTPNVLNALRFTTSAAALAIIFAKKLRVSKQALLYGMFGGIL
ncbi:MAG: hypothetical protein NC332_02250, partial [Firmicutes bacterium]|nr:hypothetical protein [Bacillota bacterium]